jgi:hypothetical protein
MSAPTPLLLSQLDPLGPSSALLALPGLNPAPSVARPGAPPPPYSPLSRSTPHTRPLLFPHMRDEPECMLVAATTPGRRYRAVSNQAGHHSHRPNGGATLSPHRAPLCLATGARNPAKNEPSQADARAVPVPVLEQLGRAELAVPCFSVGRCLGEAPAPCNYP